MLLWAVYKCTNDCGVQPYILVYPAIHLENLINPEAYSNQSTVYNSLNLWPCHKVAKRIRFLTGTCLREQPMRRKPNFEQVLHMFRSSNSFPLNAWYANVTLSSIIPCLFMPPKCACPPYATGTKHLSRKRGNTQTQNYDKRAVSCRPKLKQHVIRCKNFKEVDQFYQTARPIFFKTRENNMQIVVLLIRNSFR